MEGQSALIDAAAVAAIGATVTVLTQVVKRTLPGNWEVYGPIIAAGFSLAGVALWVLSAPTFPPARTDIWVIVSGWVAVFATSAGLYESVKMATHVEAVPPTLEDVAEPHEHLDPPAPEAPTAAPTPRPAVLTEPVVTIPEGKG